MERVLSPGGLMRQLVDNGLMEGVLRGSVERWGRLWD